MNKISVTHVSNAHNDWLRALDFYNQEIKILKKRLTEIAGNNTNRDVMKEVDHYENQFEIQLSNINKLKHDIKTNVSNVGVEAKASGAGYIDGDLLSLHSELEQKFIVEEKTINELRRPFNQFAAQWM